MVDVYEKGRRIGDADPAANLFLQVEGLRARAPLFFMRVRWPEVCFILMRGFLSFFSPPEPGACQDPAL